MSEQVYVFEHYISQVSLCRSSMYVKDIFNWFVSPWEHGLAGVLDLWDTETPPKFRQMDLQTIKTPKLEKKKQKFQAWRVHQTTHPDICHQNVNRLCNPSPSFTLPFNSVWWPWAVHRLGGASHFWTELRLAEGCQGWLWMFFLSSFREDFCE